MNHEFNLLGSGWVKVHYGMVAKGIRGVKYDQSRGAFPQIGNGESLSAVVNRSNLNKSREIWRHISSDYSPIDWHLDFKSGFRWDPTQWWFRVPYGHRQGVDIKIPWEISRAQHLPWLAMGYGVSKASKYAFEFENQLLDFMATNPPRYGVNWRCAMDVGIRAANWILAYEWFRLYGWKFSDNFNQILNGSLFDHALFISKNLEIGGDGFRGNHYLADICGLAFISHFLPDSSHTQSWRQFSYRALKEELDYQFFDEGSSFEGSTSYHRLSGEMIIYTTALFLVKDRNSFESAYLKKISKIAEFSKAITRSDGKIVQIGDCDSGRFFKIQPEFQEGSLEETHLSQELMVAAINGLLGITSDSQGIEHDWLKSLGLCSITHEPKLKNFAFSKSPSEIPEDIRHLLSERSPSGIIQNLEKNKIAHRIEKLPALPGIVSTHVYPDFGVSIWKTSSAFFSFRCGPVGQKHRGGHDHNDQLSVEYLRDGKLLKYDPGTAIYTPFPEIRNQYRSVTAHATPLVENERRQLIEPGPLNQGLFSLNGQQDALLLGADDSLLIGFCPKRRVLRWVCRTPDDILIIDALVRRSYRFHKQSYRPLKISEGYGLGIENP